MRRWFEGFLEYSPRNGAPANPIGERLPLYVRQGKDGGSRTPLYLRNSANLNIHLSKSNA